MTNFYGVSAPVGSGKTFSAMRWAAKIAKHGGYVAIAQPSIELNKQSYEKFRSAYPGVRAHVINGDNGGNVGKALADITKNPGDGGLVLFLTHSGLIGCPYWHDRTQWHLLVDEVPQVFDSEDWTLPENRDKIIPLLGTEGFNDRYSLLIAADDQAITDIAENKGDDMVHKLFQKLARRLNNAYKWKLYVLNTQWEKFQEPGSKGKLTVFELLNPNVFLGVSSTTFLSANFTQSLIYSLLMKDGHVYREHKEISDGLLYREHPNGNLLKIHWAIEDDIWSKKLRNSIPDGLSQEQKGQTLVSLIEKGAKDLFQNDKFCFLLNKDIENSSTFGVLGSKLPHSPHGLNSYSDYHNAAILPAYNPSPAVYKFLEEVAELPQEEVRRSVYREAIYQAVGRISIRKLDDENEKNVVVPDLGVANFLHDMFPGSQLVRLPGFDQIRLEGRKIPGRKKIYQSGTARKNEYRKNHKRKLLAQLDMVEADQETTNASFNEDSRKTLSPIDSMVFSSPLNEYISGSFFNSLTDTTKRGEGSPIGFTAFFEFLIICHKRVLPKEEAKLWSPARFNPDKGNTQKGLINIIDVWGIWLDNDGGDLSRDVFTSIFSDIKMIIYNSFSSTSDKPRWRVVIPTTGPTTADVYKEIINQMMKKLNNHNFYSGSQIQKRAESGTATDKDRNHGFDTTKFAASSQFYLPVQAKAGESDSFLEIYNDNQRHAINPRQWIDRTSQIDYEESGKTSYHPNKINPERRLNSESVEKALRTWRNKTSGTGDKEFFNLALSLMNAGGTSEYLESTLNQAAAHSRSEESVGDRRRRIPGIISGLRPPTSR